MSTQHRTIYRDDYTPPPFLAETVNLVVSLYDHHAEVTATTVFIRNPASKGRQNTLMLNGENLALLQVKLDGTLLEAQQYDLGPDTLSLELAGDRCTLEVVTRLAPDDNTSLEGLYRSNGNYCTQCEAEGFRKITYALDRPDVLSIFTTRIEGDSHACPVLLANGNKVDEGELADGRHYAVWHDPFPKPCYLFALVAGDLRYIEDMFTTRSGKDVTLRIYVEERNIEKCGHAMRSLKKSMRWDEDVYGLEYDLDIFMIVAVDDFNMGAMENKGLNIFNSKYVLAQPETATDVDYLGIEGVVAHEYFHNWTGNRVTCRDWFQLSLKEGLTVFRDQEFSADMNSRPLQRIDDVRILRTNQFREDSGPMAHPVRPDSYVEINNFYTTTVYNKGAEVIRMMHTLLGAEGFRKGMDLYFARHDGQAVTCDDFVAAMADANGADLAQFSLWYSQAGTPELEVTEEHDPEKEEYVLTLRQSCPATPGQAKKLPFHMPVAIGLLDKAGNDIPVAGDGTLVLELREDTERFVFKGFAEKPTLSMLRNFSAPVKVTPFQTREELAFLMAHDSDLFNRSEAAFQMTGAVIFEVVGQLQRGEPVTVDGGYIRAVAKNIDAGQRDKALLAQSLELPPETYLAGQMQVVDPDNLHLARRIVQRAIAAAMPDSLWQLMVENREGEKDYAITPEAIGRRALKNLALAYLMSAQSPAQEVVDFCLAQYETATNMTDRIAAMKLIADSDLDVREDVLEDFYASWHSDPLVMDKWLILQATSHRPDTLSRVKELMKSPVFSMKNPNKVRSLVGAFCSLNHVRFHDADGSGYRFLTERIIELNTINPQIGARMVAPFTTWKRYDGERQLLMRDQLESIASLQDLAGDIYEIVKKSL